MLLKANMQFLYTIMASCRVVLYFLWQYQGVDSPPRAKLHNMSADYPEILENLTYKNTGPAIITGIPPFFHEYSEPKAITQFCLITFGHCSLKGGSVKHYWPLQGWKKMPKTNFTVSF